MAGWCICGGGPIDILFSFAAPIIPRCHLDHPRWLPQPLQRCVTGRDAQGSQPRGGVEASDAGQLCGGSTRGAGRAVAGRRAGRYLTQSHGHSVTRSHLAGLGGHGRGAEEDRQCSGSQPRPGLAPWAHGPTGCIHCESAQPPLAAARRARV